MKSFKSLNWAVAAAIACLGLSMAQTIAPDEMHARTFPYVPPPPLTLRTETTLVEIPVVVRDGRKRAVAGLTRDDFEVYDAGMKQTLSAFSVESFGSPGDTRDAGSGARPAVTPQAPQAPKNQPRPRMVALLFDDLHTDAPNLKAAKDAAQRFVKTALAPGDRVAVVTTAAPSQSPEFTADVPTLVERIAKVTTREKTGPCARRSCRPPRAWFSFAQPWVLLLNSRATRRPESPRPLSGPATSAGQSLQATTASAC